jgi:hypothetical protein
MKKLIASLLFFGSFSMALAHTDSLGTDTTRVFNQDPYPLDSGMCIVSHFDKTDARYHECAAPAISKDRCMATRCDIATVIPTIIPSVLPMPAASVSSYYANSLGYRIGTANIPVFRPSGSSAFVLTLKAQLFGVVFRNCPADSSRTDLKNDYMVVKISDGLPPYSITTPGFISQSMRVEGNVSYWGVRVTTPRYEATRIPLSIRDSVGQIVSLSAQTYACPS